MTALALACGSLFYFALEVAFYCIFKWYLLPAANKRVDVHPYRDYEIGERHRIILRCLGRLQRNAKGESVEEVIRSYLLSWFHEQKAVIDVSRFLLQNHQDKKHLSRSISELSQVTASTEDESMSASDCSEEYVSKTRWTIEELGRTDMERLFAWAAFGKDVERLNEEELDDLEQVFVGCEERFGLYFREGSTQKYTAKRLNLEDITASHRPLFIYLIVFGVRLIAGLWLVVSGFRPCYSQGGMKGWFRPARNETSQLPLLFFHGIAPGGIAFYLPMVLKGLCADDRAVFLFENPAISTDLFAGLKPLTEQSTLEGVREILNRFMPHATDLAVVGHSFGTVPLTWLLHCPKMRHHIRQAVLLDPVTILLTTPDVMNSFLYSTNKKSNVRLVSTELLVQNYIRRHFPYYNSDLWFEDLPSEDCQVLVCISENDDVIDAVKVRHESEKHLQRQDSGVIYWDKGKHGDCVIQSRKWKEIKMWMVDQESLLFLEPSRAR